jgi:SLT domain-containing protein
MTGKEFAEKILTASEKAKAHLIATGYATGSQSVRKGIALVGEAGPELVRFRGGEQVLNAKNTQKVLSGAGTSNNFNVTFNNLQDTTAFALMQQLKQYNRTLAINGII